MQNKINVAIIGLGFGKEFIQIYQQHPNVDKVAICARTKEKLDKIGDQFNIAEDMRFTNYEDVLKSKDIDAIHIVTPILEHAKQSLEALNAGKHTACTVPMATSVEECKAIVEAKNKMNKVYMMMETVIYSREFLYVKNLVETGKIGRIQFARGSHIQDMGLEGWPEYWLGFPPMHYGTHAIAPLLTINKSKAESVVCHGSGSISEDKAIKYGSPFAVETATIKLKDSNVVVEATRALYETVRQYRESFDVYGDQSSFEWEQIADEGHIMYDGGEDSRRIHVPDTDSLLPVEIASFTKKEQIDDKNHVSFIQGAGHGGSHPHLVNEFVNAIVEKRDSAVDAVVSANITCTGICAHESALKSGERVMIPDFSEI